MKIENATAMVTGGASGLGLATARALHALGAKVVLVDLAPEETGQALARELGERARYQLTDVADDQSARRAVEATEKAFGPVRILVNCAGIAVAQKILGKEGPADLAAFAKVIAVNLTGTFNLMRLAAASMARAEPDADGARGVIVNTASIAAFDGQIGQAAYAASKGGIVAMTLPAARELARHGIRVVTIAPGIFETPMLAKVPPAARATLSAEVPFPSRLGKPEEYAALVRHIVENPMLNGEVIRLDGALRMGRQ
ncbi:MAG: 3-hydroxyacyl-CoA dehydrogenase [Myxococcales bacterium]|nr:3-hydroxyacyl-CoA dehydrogenase [Myxococcales bacterium]